MKLQSGYRMKQRDFTVINEVHEKHRKSNPIPLSYEDSEMLETAVATYFSTEDGAPRIRLGDNHVDGGDSPATGGLVAGGAIVLLQFWLPVSLIVCIISLVCIIHSLHLEKTICHQYQPLRLTGNLNYATCNTSN